MTYYIYEDESGRTMGEYVDDGKQQVTLVTEKSSVLTRKIRVPGKLKKAVEILSP